MVSEGYGAALVYGVLSYAPVVFVDGDCGVCFWFVVVGLVGCFSVECSVGAFGVVDVLEVF